jgi:hypothetical protein
MNGNPALCHKAIATIFSKANRKLVDSLQNKVDLLFKKPQALSQQSQNSSGPPAKRQRPT